MIVAFVALRSDAELRSGDVFAYRLDNR